MDFDLSPDQGDLMNGLERLLARHAEIPPAARKAWHVQDESLNAALDDAGFLAVAQMDGMGRLEAALVAERIGRLPATVEAAATLLVAPEIGFAVQRPLALIDGSPDGAYRNLAVARTALIDRAGAMHVLPVGVRDVVPVATIFAYPYGRFRALPDLSACRTLDAATSARVRHWWRVAIVAEAAGAMRAAIDFTVQHSKDRHLFGRPLGGFQSVQHRLAECHQIQRATYQLLLKAAWSGAPIDALLAASYAQGHVQKLMFDLHQFNGAMGLTNEALLHFWTYRLRALQAELGGADAAALEAADALWPSRSRVPEL
jgi:alkylation response protein AidB-like acyl-CoA dehydrogenase